MIVGLYSCTQCKSTCWPSCQLHYCLLTFPALVVPSAEAQENAAQLIAVLPSQPAALPHLPAGPGGVSARHLCKLNQMTLHNVQAELQRFQPQKPRPPICNMMYCLQETCIVHHKAMELGWYLPHAGAAAQSAAVLVAWLGWPLELA